MSDPKHLIAGYLDDELTEAERQELTAWLKAHPDNLRAFVEANAFDQNLRSAVASQRQREAMEPLVRGEGLVSWPGAGRAGRAAHNWLRRLWPPLATVGALVLLWVAPWESFLHRLRSSSPASPLAAVVQTSSARVPEFVQAFQAGQALPAGRLALVAGVVELVLSNGVTVVFEGPGEMELLTPMRALLHSGQAVVRVPEPARGFRLETTGAQVVDLGTEFGVKCGPGGVTDVQVFEGKVVASATAASAGFPCELGAGKATRFSPNQPAPTEIDYGRDRFVRRLPSDMPIELDEKVSPLFNATRFEEITIPHPENPIRIDGDLSDWTPAHSFRTAREGAAGEFIEGRMRYDSDFLYIAAHIGDPAPMRNLTDPNTDGELGWRGGGLQVRLSTDAALGWPVDANSPEYYSMRRLPADAAQVARSTDHRLTHLTLWYFAPGAQPCLHIAYGMDFRRGLINPSGYRGACRRDSDGRGYTLEYAIPWGLLNAPRAPNPGETLAVSWTTHWSDETGRLWRGQVVELRNAGEPMRIHTWERAATWGRALYR